jgi:uncharacterized OB-fold protein
MPILEKLVQPGEARHWLDSIPLEYHYTAGVAGEEFRRELRGNGRFLVSKCSKCKSTFVPARMYCPDCFVEMKDQFPIDKPGYVYSFTIVNRKRSGEESDSPITVGLIKFDGVKGGMVHLLDIDHPSEISIGMKVTPVLRDSSKRNGAITDILGFKPISKSARTKEAPTETGATPLDSQDRMLLRVIDESGYPIEEDPAMMANLRTKIGRGERLTSQEDKLLHRLGERSRDWRKAVKSSAETEVTDTLSG